MLKELGEDLNSMKKIQSEMKDTLTEIKNNLQGNSNQGSTTRRGYMQPIHMAHLEYPVWVKGEAVPLALQDTYYIRSHYQGRESLQLFLIHRNRHREAAKVRRQRNRALMKEQIKTPKKN